MYTQCSKCETVFKLSAEVLRAAGGQVRCGKCGEVFNALARLAEDSSAFETGESSLDLEERADSILESVVALQADEAAPRDGDEFALPGVEIAHLQILDADEDGNFDDPAERSMEFTLPPGELDRIFIESKKSTPPLAPSLDLDATDTHDAVGDAGAALDDALAALVDASAARDGAAAAPHAPGEPPPHPESDDLRERRTRNLSGLEVSEAVRREMLEGMGRTDQIGGGEPEEDETPYQVLRYDEPQFETPARPARRSEDRRSAERRTFALWLGTAILSALLLMGQWVHANREWLIAHGPLGGTLRALYSSLGAPVSAPANLSAYQLRQWGVTGEPDAGGTLRVRASILNLAPQLQPYPLLRVTLANRFGSRIGARDFEPSEYLGKPTARLLAPGERVDATLDILDPGKNAEGFEIDVCLRQPDHKIACASDVAPQAKK